MELMRQQLPMKFWVARHHRMLRQAPMEPWIYAAMIGAFGVVSNFWNPVLGCLLDGLLMMWLVYRGSAHESRDIGRLLLCISVCPMTRIISLAISPKVFLGVWYYVTTESIVLVAGLFCVLVAGLRLKQIGFRLDKHLWTIPLTLFSGPVVGWLESHVVPPFSLSTSITWSTAWLHVILLVMFTGFTEEFVFRGIIQHTAEKVCPSWTSILFTATLWSSLHTGWDSWLEIPFVLMVGVFWSVLRYFNQGIFSIVFAHGLANVMFFIVIPNINK